MAADAPGPGPAQEQPAWYRSLLGKAMAEVGVVVIVHSAKLYEAWKACGSDKLCRGEKLIKYITMILGVTRPAIILSHILRNITNKLWLKLRGRVLIEKDSTVGNAVIDVGVYASLELWLRSIWDKCEYWTECLRTDGCDDDDMLIWIKNMRLGYCTFDEKTDDHEVDLDTEDDEIQDTGDYCTAFFNVLPLILLTFTVWVAYLLSMTVTTDEENNGGDGNNGPAGGGEDGGGDNGGSGDGKGPEGGKGKGPERDKGKGPEGDKGKGPEGDKGKGPEGDKGKGPEGDKGKGPERNKGKGPEGDKGKDPKGDKGKGPEGDKGKGPEGDKGKGPEGDKGKPPEGDKGKGREGDKGGSSSSKGGGPGTSGCGKGGSRNGNGSKNDNKKGESGKGKAEDSKKKTENTGTSHKRKDCKDCSPTQEVELSCSCCKQEYVCNFPDPLLVICTNCAGSDKEKKENPNSSRATENSSRSSVGPLAGSSIISGPKGSSSSNQKGKSCTCADSYSVDGTPAAGGHYSERETHSYSSNLDDSFEDLSDDEKYSLLTKTIYDQYDELMECLNDPLCEVCRYHHADHICTHEQQPDHIDVDVEDEIT